MSENVINLTSEDFSSGIEEGFTVVDFWAEWCGPCKMFAPIFEEVSAEVEGVKFAKVDVDTAASVAQDHGVMSIPTVILFQDGQPVKRVSGSMSASALKEFLNS